ncbi:TetR/AcrR family transcriptional regulator [Rhodococcus erythropolis]|uniref:TetR/AcrR family transcriptional regulator n=1 Tax=Rhodococcus erythropolis TaxID=1833 RepID=UPI00210DC66F|nr:TetR/AcrR family transcriptional regulator [Rhodococcus erythropolis]MCQ4127653.1 TetR/AcrR family transcriptional regulator [Rhodococcus erythropolis]
MKTPAPAARRSQLIHAAEVVFTTHGYHASSVADIAQQAGVSHGTFYNYFKNKQDALEAIVDSTTQEFLDIFTLNPTTTLNTFDELLEHFNTVLHAGVELAQRKTDIIELIVFDAAAADSSFFARSLGTYIHVSRAVEEALARAVARNMISSDTDTMVYSETIVALALALILPGSETPETNRTKDIDALLDFVRHALSNR